jgi:hypothetical protein
VPAHGIAQGFHNPCVCEQPGCQIRQALRRAGECIGAAEDAGLAKQLRQNAGVTGEHRINDWAFTPRVCPGDANFC